MPDEHGILRQRVARLADLRNPAAGDRGSPAIVARVFDNGAMPTTVPAYYATHLVTMGGTEAEGGAGTRTVGTNLTPVMVIDKVPAVGDDLIARRIGGRWVAERGKTTAAQICGCLGTDPAAIPTPLHLTQTVGSLFTPGSPYTSVLTWSPGACQWESSDVHRWALSYNCATGTWVLTTRHVSGTNNCSYNLVAPYSTTPSLTFTPSGITTCNVITVTL